MEKGGGRFIGDAVLPAAAAQLPVHLRDTDNLRAVAPDRFPAALARVYGVNNQIHFAREGNGRTNREVVSMLAAHNGFRVDWTVVKGAMNDRISRQAVITGSMAGYEAMFQVITRPTDRPRATAATPNPGDRGPAQRPIHLTGEDSAYGPRVDGPRHRGPRA